MCIPKRLVQPTILQKLRLRSRCLDFSVVYHDNLIRIYNGGESVGNDDERFSFHKPCHALLNNGFVLRIGIGGSFVQNNDRSIFQHGASDGNALFFSSGKMSSAAAHASLKAVLQTHNELITAAVARSLLHLDIRCTGSAHADILPHSIVKKKIILRHISNESGIVFGRNIADIRAAHCNAPAIRVPKRGDKFCNRGFSASRRTDECVDRSFAESQVHAVQNLCLSVAEMNVV